MERKYNKQPKLHIRTGDLVKVIAGNSKGQSGKVIKMLVEKQRAVVEGVNMITKHIKPTAANPQGELRKTEGSVHISNLMLIDPATGEATRTGRKLNEQGKLQRYAKDSGKFIPEPSK
ncbi:MAG: 50S ribosomal protein L24 [Spirosomataceae bacterium]